ncbi:MAG: hypothetical protein ACKOQM_06240 [Novosphingobium sp.]
MNQFACRLVATSALCILGVAALPALAAEKLDYANIPIIVDQACDGIGLGGTQPTSTDIEYDGAKWRIVPTSRVAYFVNSYAGEITTPQAAFDLLRSFDTDPTASAAHRKASNTLHQFEAKLASANLDGLMAFDANGNPVKSAELDRNSSWMLGSGITLRCLLPEPRDANGPAQGSAPSFRLRGTVEALAAVGNARNSAEAASFGYTRTRTYEADGSRSQATELSVKAVVGAVLDRGSPFELTAYAGWELKKNRKSPAPALTPPATQRDGDTDIVTLGLIGNSNLPLGGADHEWDDSLRLSYSASYLFDRVKDSERLKAELTTHFYHGKRIFGLCKIGALTDLGGNRWVGCQIDGVATYQRVTKHGLLLPAGDDHFGHAGIRLSGSFFLGDPSKGSSLFANAGYQYLWRYDGDPAFIPNIARHSFSVGHRWWQGKKFAIEINAELTDGINPDSFVNENSLTVGFGILF